MELELGQNTLNLLKRFRDSTVSSGDRWRVRLPVGLTEGAARQLVDEGMADWAVCSLAEAARLAECGAESMLVSLPTRQSDLELLPRVVERLRLVLTVDHFVHAEQIANVASEVQLSILLQGAQSGPGIRPGLDAVRLAEGIRSSGDLQVTGISLAGEVCDLSSLLAAAQATRGKVQSLFAGCAAIHVLHSGASPADPQEVSGLESCVPLLAVADESRSCDVPRQLGAVPTLATVISRPSLDCVVLDVGREHLGAADAEFVLPDYPEIPLDVRADHAVLPAIGPAAQLTIGSQVAIAVLQ